MKKDSLLFSRKFWLTFWTQFFGAFNDNVYKNALVILVAFKSYSLLGLPAEQVVALSGGIFILPFFLFSATAGQVADKYPKDKLIKIIKFAEIVIMCSGAIGFLFESVEVLVSTLFFMGLQSTFFGPIKYSILPELVDENELVAGNALFSMGTFLAILLGTITGGVLIAKEVAPAEYVSVSVIVFALIGFLFSLGILKMKAISPDRKINFGIIKPSIEVLRVSRKKKSVFGGVLGISWFWFLGATLLSIFPIYALTTLNADQDTVTLFLAIFSIGVGCGSIICERVSKGHLELGLVVFGAIGMTIFLFDLFLIGTPSFVTEQRLQFSVFFDHFTGFRILADLFLFSVCGGFYTVPLYTAIQKLSDPKDRSMVIAGNNILNALFMVVASVLLIILLGLKLSIPKLFLIYSLINLVVAFAIYRNISEYFWRLFCVCVMKILYKVEVNGAQNIPEDGPLIITANHISFIDWLFLAVVVKKPVRFVMHYEFMSIPLVNIFFKGSKVIPIAGKKEDEKIMHQAFESIHEELQKGEIVCIFPEGEITNTGKLTYFRPGLEKTIERSPVDVVPFAISGLWGSFFSRKYGKAMSKYSVLFYDLRPKIVINVGERIKSDDVNAKALELVTQNLLDKNSL